MHIPIPANRRPTAPGEMLLKEFLEPMGVTQTAFAERIGVTGARLSAIVKGKRVVTPDTALRFARATRTSPDLWLNLQTTVDLYDAMHADNAAAIKKIVPLPLKRAKR